jgi:protein TonB
VLHLGNPWGGNGVQQGSSVNVNLVGNSGLPMPKPPDISNSNVVDPSHSLFNEEVKPKGPTPPPEPKDAIKIPEKQKPQKQAPPHASKIFPNKIPAPDNAVAGHGGQPDIPVGTGSTPGSTPGSIGAIGQGGMDFSSRYGWYIDAVRRRVNQNWMQNTIDPAVRAARTAHCTMTFTIARDGSVKDIRLMKTSGNVSMDNSAQRALLSSSPMPQLPGDYSGSYVNVTFDFDLALAH